MNLLRLETPGIAHYAYLLADGGEAVVVDPCRDTDRYIDKACELGVRIRFVMQTHRHEDFLVGAADLADRTGAEIAVGEHDLFGRSDRRLGDGEALQLGSAIIRAVRTPGHTPESTCYAVYTDESDRDAWAVFTGDTLFFGDTGRTDLPDADKAVDNAALLYRSVHSSLADLGDGAVVLPAHGAGSVCGSGMASLPASTLGREKQHNPVFTATEQQFAEAKGGERLPRPPYFRAMEELNLEGGRGPNRQPVRMLGPDAFADAMGNSRVLDTRSPEAFAAAHVAGSLSVWLAGVPAFGGWLATEDDAIALVCDRGSDAMIAHGHLSRIGLDGPRVALAGGFDSWRSSGRPLVSSGVTTPIEVREKLGGARILDVREPDEFAAGHIPGADNIYVGDLETELPDRDWERDEPLVVTCGVGHRAGLGVSILRRHGFSDVRNLLGGMKAWTTLDLPTES